MARSADSGRWFRWLRRREEIRGAELNQLFIYCFFLLTPKSTIRFDPLCGEFNDKLFKESYQFVNEVKSKELVELKKQLRTEEDRERREEVLEVNQELMIILFPLPSGEVPDSKNGEPAQSRSSEPSETSPGRGREF